MKRKLSAVEARKHLGEILEGVYYRHDEVVIQRAGKPMAVVIPAYLYENIERSRDRIMEFAEKNWEHNKDVPYEEIEVAISEAVSAVRAEMRKEIQAHKE